MPHFFYIELLGTDKLADQPKPTGLAPKQNLLPPIQLAAYGLGLTGATKNAKLKYCFEHQGWTPRKLGIVYKFTRTKVTRLTRQQIIEAGEAKACGIRVLATDPQPAPTPAPATSPGADDEIPLD